MFLLLTSKSLFSLSGLLPAGDPGGLGDEVTTPGEGVLGVSSRCCCCWLPPEAEGPTAAAAAILPPPRTPMLDLLIGVSRVACAEILRSERSREASKTPGRTHTSFLPSFFAQVKKGWAKLT